MNLKVDINIEDDALDQLIVESLQYHYHNFGVKQDIPFVSHDAVEESEYIKKMRKALKRVIKFYGGNVD
jgi:hypothetical protein